MTATRALATYRDVQLQLRRRSSAAVAAAWSRLGSYDDVDVARFVDQIRPVVEGARQASARATDAYLTSYVQGGPQGLPPPQIRNGVTIDEVYRRPFVEVWSELQAGRRWVDAVASGQIRAVAAVNTDVQLAATHTSQMWIETQPQVTGFRRVLGPGNNCGLCVAASTQRYRRQDLMPIHSNCGCSVAPLFDGGRPDRDAYDEVLRLADPVADRQGRNVTDRRVLSRVRVGNDMPDVQVREHGELGPTLTDASHNFTQL